MKIDELALPKWMTGKTDIEQAQAELDAQFKQEVRKVPSIAKATYANVVQSIAPLLKANPQANVAPTITKLISDAVRFRSYKLRDFTGDVNNKQQLMAYITDAITKFYQEKVYGLVLGVDANNDGRDDTTGAPAQDLDKLTQQAKQQQGRPAQASQAPAIDPKWKETLDKLTPDQLKQLAGMIA